MMKQSFYYPSSHSKLPFPTRDYVYHVRLLNDLLILHRYSIMFFHVNLAKF